MKCLKCNKEIKSECYNCNLIYDYTKEESLDIYLLERTPSNDVDYIKARWCNNKISIFTGHEIINIDMSLESFLSRTDDILNNIDKFVPFI